MAAAAKSNPDDLQALTFEQFREFARQSGAENRKSPQRVPVSATCLVLPLIDKGAGKPFTVQVSEIFGDRIRMISPTRLDDGQRFCIRLEMALMEAAWVECQTLRWDLTSDGCEIEARYLHTNCPHACNCPLILFFQGRKIATCPYAGHDGCLQTGPAGPQIRQLLGA